MKEPKLTLPYSFHFYYQWHYQSKNPVCLSWQLLLFGLPSGSVVKNLPANTGDTRDVGSILGSGRSPGEGNGNPFQYSCLGNPMDGRAWKAAVHGVAEGRTWLSEFTFTFHFDALEEEMATHSSVLAWRIPGTGHPGGLLSMGSHRVGHDWSDSAAAAAGTEKLGRLQSMGLQRSKTQLSD